MGSSEPMTTQQRPLRLAILEADTPVPGVLAKYGKYGSVFAHLFRQACAPDSLESQLTLSAHDVVNDPSSYPDPETLDAVLITGSKHSAFEDHEWILRLVAYTKRLLEQPAARPDGRPPVRVIGVCFGHQIVGRAMGAPVGRSDRGWELSVVDMALTDEGKRIFGGETLKIHHMHRDIVHEYPKGTIPPSPHRRLRHPGHFTEDIMREILEVRHKGGILPDSVFEDAMSRAPDAHDGVAIARAFLKFLRE
ncbi:hypothetical protein PG989_005883 [Apiospora arundinis]